MDTVTQNIPMRWAKYITHNEALMCRAYSRTVPFTGLIVQFFITTYFASLTIQNLIAVPWLNDTSTMKYYGRENINDSKIIT